MLAGWSGEEAYVLAVLRRAEAAPVRLVIGADAQVFVEGCLAVASRHLSLSSARATIYVGQIEAGEEITPTAGGTKASPRPAGADR